MTYVEQAIEELDSISQKLLCLMAYNGNGTAFETLGKMASQHTLSQKKTKEILQVMVDRGICTQRYFTNFYDISPAFFLPTIRFLVVQHTEWIDELKKYKVRGVTPLNLLRDNAIALLQGKQKLKGQMDFASIIYDTSKFTLPAALYPEFYPLIEQLSSYYIGSYINDVITMLFCADITDKYDHVLQLLDRLENITDGQKEEAKEMVALYQYYASGEYHPIGKGKSLFDCILRGIHALHEKDYDEAESLLGKALKLRNQNSNIKNVFMNMITCYFLIAYYIHNPTEKNNKKLQQFVKKKDINECNSLIPAYIVASWHTDLVHEVDSTTLRRLHTRSMTDNLRSLKSMANYLSAAFDEKIPETLLKEYMPRHAILQHEFQYFLNLDENRRKELNDMFGEPILFDKKPMARWEIILNEMANNCQPGTVQESMEEGKKERIAYILKNGRVEVREQTLRKNGEWNAGKEISSGRYSEGNLKMMDDVDQQIWKANHGSSYYMSIDTVLPYLIGSDRVLTGYYAPFLNVTVEEEKPFILVERNKKGFSITSNLPELDERNEYVKRMNDIHYVVIRVSQSEKIFFQQLLELKQLPLEAEDKLREVLPVISSKIQIESPLIKDTNKLETIKSSSLIVLQVRPENGYHFNVHLYAKASPDLQGLYEPGHGSASTLDRDQQGNLKRVKRNLGKERENLINLNTFIKSLKFGPGDLFGNTSSTTETLWSLGLNQMLDTMEYVNEHADIYAVEWPEGEKLRMKSISQQQWNVNLRQESNWFKMEGEIEIDDDITLKIGQLMQLADLTKNQNYVRLNDTDFIKLTDAMRKRLAQLEALSVKDKNEYRIPLTNALLLNDTLDEELPIEKGEELKEVLEKIRKSYKLNPRTPRNLKATLRDYQLEGFRWMLRLDSWGAGACLADDMGLGKTIQTIAVLLNKAKNGASLIVAPTSVISNWKNEIERFAPSLHTVMLNELDSEKRVEEVEKASAEDVLLVTYGILCTEAEILTEKEWNIICLDEAHTIKNRETKTAQAVYALKSETRIALTGTPLQNHLGELWSLFNFINPGMLGSYEAFRQRFVLPIENGDKERQQLLRRVVLPFILRRTKKEVIEELPEKTEIQYKVELSPEEMHTYEYIRNKAQQQLEEEQKVSVSVLAEITKLRQAACASGLVKKELNFLSSKLEQMMQLVNEINQGENRVLIFSQFTSFLKMVRDRLDKEKIDYLYLDGSTTMKQREDMVKRFQNGESGIFIISLKAGGLGLNLTGANYVIHMDPWWNPAIEQQATDRAYRIGQEQKVTVYHLISAHTIEEKILRLHQTKRDLADSLLEGADVSHKLTEEDLKELLS